MKTSTSDKILSMTQRLFARRGYEGVSMRLLGERLHIVPSVIYHYFSDKDVLLKQMYERTHQELADRHKMLVMAENFPELVKSHVQFELSHMQEIVAVSKYYLHFRTWFLRNGTGKLPDQEIMEIEKVLQLGVDQGFFKNAQVKKEAKTIQHLIRGHILEIFPATLQPVELTQLSNELTEFVVNALKKYKLPPEDPAGKKSRNPLKFKMRK